MKRVTVGIDASYTNTGVAIFFNGVYQKEICFTVSTNPKTGSDIERSEIIADKIIDALDKIIRYRDDSMHIFIEDYAFARANNREKMGELGGIIKYTLKHNAFNFETLPISTVRKIVCGKGNASKDIVMLSLLKRHGLDIPQNDSADAAAVAIAGDFITRAREDELVISTWPKETQEAIRSYLKVNP
jgi:Holliday junction resolvasome RuvABC endonuclease subunit